MDKNLAPAMIVMLANSGHQPTDTRIFQKEAITLCEAGFEVKLIIPTEKSYTEYGVEVIAVVVPKNGLQKLTLAPWRVFRAALQQPRQAWFHLHDSELLLMGVLLKLMGRKVIYDAHEDTPRQIAYQHWIPWFLKKPYAWFYFLLERFCGLIFNGIIVAEPVIARHYPKSKTILIRNFPKLESFRRAASIPFSNRKKQMVYVGLLSEPRGFSAMVAATESARQKVDFKMVLGGKFSPAGLEEKLKGTSGIAYLSWVPYEKLPDLLFESQVGIIVPEPNPRYLTNYPVKLFEYMAAGLAVIASEQGEASEFVREANAGVLVNARDSSSIARAMVQLFSNQAEAEQMGERGRKLVFEKYNWASEGKKLVDWYRTK
jgi:glycosyltransferase involved in cell wall biosynthesis